MRTGFSLRSNFSSFVWSTTLIYVKRTVYVLSRMLKLNSTLWIGKPHKETNTLRKKNIKEIFIFTDSLFDVHWIY